MASGYGLQGGPSRCFSYWQDVLGCYVVNTNTDDVSGAKKCAPVLEDYYECLHHKKEDSLTGKQHLRVKAMQEAYRRAETRTPRENQPTAPQIRQLGLLGKEQMSKDLIDAANK